MGKNEKLLEFKRIIRTNNNGYRGYYIKKDNTISLYAYKMYGSDALCTILEKPIEYKFIINNDSLDGTFKDDFGTMKFVTTSFDNLNGINSYIKNIEETVYENE